MQFFKKYDMAIYWLIIILAMIFSVWKNGIMFALSGVFAGAIIMELIAKGSYYLLKNDVEDDEKNKSEKEKNVEEKTNYIDENKRTFSEGNTYLMAAVGALLGLKLVPIVIILAILLQVVLIIPQFVMNLYKEKRYRLVFSITTLAILSIIYLIVTSFVKLNFYVACIFALLIIFFAADTLINLREKVNNQGYCEVPFGSFLIASAIIAYFYGVEILNFLLRYLFRIG